MAATPRTPEAIVKRETLEPHWPSLAAFFERAAIETTNKVKAAEFRKHAADIRAYLAANPDKDN